MNTKFKPGMEAAAFRTLERILASADWMKYFCQDLDGSFKKLYESEDTVRNMARCIEWSGFYSESDMNEILHESLLCNMLGISKWMCRKGGLLYRSTIHFDRPVGYVLKNDKSPKVEAYNIRLILMKEREGKTNLGIAMGTFSPE